MPSNGRKWNDICSTASDPHRFSNQRAKYGYNVIPGSLLWLPPDCARSCVALTQCTFVNLNICILACVCTHRRATWPAVFTFVDGGTRGDISR